MVFFIVFIILIIVGFIYLVQNTFDSTIGKAIAYIVSTPLAVVVSVFLSAIFTMSISFCGYLLPSVEYESTSEAIYGLEDNIGIQGRFVLGSGSVNSEIKIYYTTKDEYGSLIKSINQTSVRIKEDNSEAPNLKRVGKRYKHEFFNWIFFDPNEWNDIYVMTVPENTIISEYNIDLKS